MSLRTQAKILGVHHTTLSKCINGQRKWNPELKARYEELTATTFATTPLKYEVKYVCEESNLGVAHSSSGLGHRPLKAEITGSNPVCATSIKCKSYCLRGII